jgi:hypothetical protein
MVDFHFFPRLSQLQPGNPIPYIFFFIWSSADDFRVELKAFRMCRLPCCSLIHPKLSLLLVKLLNARILHPGDDGLWNFHMHSGITSSFLLDLSIEFRGVKQAVFSERGSQDKSTDPRNRSSNWLLTISSSFPSVQDMKSLSGDRYRSHTHGAVDGVPRVTSPLSVSILTVCTICALLCRNR